MAQPELDCEEIGHSRAVLATNSEENATDSAFFMRVVCISTEKDQTTSPGDAANKEGRYATRK